MGQITDRNPIYVPLAIPAPWIIDEQSKREKRPSREEARLELPRAQDEMQDKDSEDSPQHDGVIIIDL